MSNERVNDERLAEMLRIDQRERARFAAGTFSFDRHSERISIITELRQRRASVVTPEATEAACDLLASLDPDALNPEQFNAHCALTAALSVSHETGDGENRPCTCHPDDKPPVPCSKKYALSECQAAADETQGVKREPVGYVREDTLGRLRGGYDGPIVGTPAFDTTIPLFSLSQLEAADRSVAYLTDQLETVLDQLSTAEARADTAEASLAAMTEALTPSGGTKAAYMGEFTIAVERQINDDDEVDDETENASDPYEHITVPWTTIKEIMAAIAARAGASS